MKKQIVKINNIFLSATVLLIFQLASHESMAQSSKHDGQTYESTRQLLVEMKTVDTNESFISLFNTGDNRITDLVKALNDSNGAVRRNAQMIIRYLDNDLGMSALITSYSKEKAHIVVAGPVPTPLREWDYDYISKSYKNLPSASYIYALAIDSSPKAKAVLSELTANTNNNPKANYQDLEKVKIVNPNDILVDSSDLAKTVLDKAFFVSSEDKQFATSKFISFNAANDKALIEIYINRGVLSEEWYHVVINKSEKGWKFLSITPVATS
ncbi:MAG TPA: hypothetical protein VK468_08760 [Pyrinomonadaceae bacterium]|nr:hypothetical protein [Pyrinomonadaceae bacterium]